MANVAVEKQTPSAKGEERHKSGLERSSAPFFSQPFGFSPFAAMRRMAEHMERAFAEWPSPFETEGGQRTTWWPAVEVSEEDGHLNINADLPGLKPENVKVEVTQDTLVIEGERKQEHEEKHKSFHRSERTYGHFYRSIPLPDGAKTDQAQAEFQNGELKVSIPVPESPVSRRQIPVKAK